LTLTFCQPTIFEKCFQNKKLDFLFFPKLSNQNHWCYPITTQKEEGCVCKGVKFFVPLTFPKKERYHRLSTSTYFYSLCSNITFCPMIKFQPFKLKKYLFMEPYGWSKLVTTHNSQLFNGGQWTATAFAYECCASKFSSLNSFFFFIC
jgi:hypothetical protein